MQAAAANDTWGCGEEERGLVFFNAEGLLSLNLEGKYDAVMSFFIHDKVDYFQHQMGNNILLIWKHMLVNLHSSPAAKKTNMMYRTGKCSSSRRKIKNDTINIHYMAPWF